MTVTEYSVSHFKYVCVLSLASCG